MQTIYLTEEGSYVRKKENRILITKDKETIAEFPIEKIQAIVLFGGCNLTSAAATTFMDKGIPVTWLSKSGKFFGRLESTSHINIEKQRLQFLRREDEAFCLSIAKRFIIAKLKNYLVLLRRYNRSVNSSEVSKLIEQCESYYSKINDCQSINSLYGFEGAFSKIYFKSLGLLARGDFYFTKRTRQPPLDKFNSLLSFGYTLLIYDLYTCILNEGLHPYVGFLHQIRKGHPALASDLIEEWRPVIIDSLIMTLVNRGELKAEDFQPSAKNGGVYLNREGSKKFVKKYEEKIRQNNSYRNEGNKPITYRDSLREQVKSLYDSIKKSDEKIYQPILIR